MADPSLRAMQLETFAGIKVIHAKNLMVTEWEEEREGREGQEKKMRGRGRKRERKEGGGVGRVGGEEWQREEEGEKGGGGRRGEGKKGRRRGGRENGGEEGRGGGRAPFTDSKGITGTSKGAREVWVP